MSSVACIVNVSSTASSASCCVKNRERRILLTRLPTIGNLRLPMSTSENANGNILTTSWRPVDIKKLQTPIYVPGIFYCVGFVNYCVLLAYPRLYCIIQDEQIYRYKCEEIIN